MLFCLAAIHGMAIPRSADVTSAGNRRPMVMRPDTLSAFHKITLGIGISVNTADADALTAIPGIGPKTAAMIVAERIRHGEFHSLEKLKTITGIGQKRYQTISPYLIL